MDETFAIESFISYCDTMIIAEEGMKEIGKSILIRIKNAFRKVATWFKNLLLNVNQFKNAVMPEKLNQDLVKLLQMSQSRLEKNFVIVSKEYLRQKKKPEELQDGRAYGVYKMGIFGDNLSTTFVSDEVEKCYREVDNALTSAKNSSMYQRIQKNEYNDEKKVIPLSNIIQDMKISQMGSTKMLNFMNVIENRGEINPLYHQMIQFLQKAIAYYNFRISLLSKYFQSAKASLSALKNNIQHKKDDAFTTRTRSENSLYWEKAIIMLPKTYRRAEELYRKCKSCTSYTKYLPMYNELTKILKCPHHVITHIRYDGRACIVTAMPEKKTKISIEGRVLYHSSDNSNLSQLIPRFVSPGGILYPTPRVYVHVGVPLDRYSQLKSDTSKYIVTDKISYVYQDPELGRTAAYIETTKPIHVKKM